MHIRFIIQTKLLRWLVGGVGEINKNKFHYLVGYEIIRAMIVCHNAPLKGIGVRIMNLE